jgi:hypothetical protein
MTPGQFRRDFARCCWRAGAAPRRETQQNSAIME